MTTTDLHEREFEWVLLRWRKGLDVFTPYIDGPRHWADHVDGFSADWEEIACGTYDYIKALKQVLGEPMSYERPEANYVR